MYARIALVFHSLLVASPLDNSPFFPFWRGVCKFSPYFVFWVTGNVYPFAKSQYCLIRLITESSEDPRPEVKGILQSKTTAVKLIQFLDISTSDSAGALIF